MTKLPLLTLALTLCLMELATVAQAQLYRWVEADGKVVYSDKIPPQANALGHAELNSSFVQNSERNLSNYDQAIAQGLTETVKINQQYELDKKRLAELLQAKQTSPAPTTSPAKPEASSPTS